jgi:hypothetical protein
MQRLDSNLPEQTAEHIRIGGTMIPKPPLFLYDQRLFMLLMGWRKSPLLSLLDSDSFNRILAHCGPFQKTAWTRWNDKDALKEWLALDTTPPLQDLSLLILGLKHWPARNQAPFYDDAKKNQRPIWKTVFTFKALAFEIRCQGQLYAAGALHWCNSLLFATPSDSANNNTRGYVRLHMGKMGKRSSADRPVRAHIGLVTPFQQKKRVMGVRFAYYSGSDDDDSDDEEERYEEVTRFRWDIADDCAFSFEEIPTGEWRTVLSMQALSLRIKWVNQ